MKAQGLDELLRQALTELEGERDRLVGQIATITTVLNGSGRPHSTQRVSGRRPMSKANRLSVSRRMKAYWSARRKVKAQRTRKATPRAARKAAA